MVHVGRFVLSDSLFQTASLLLTPSAVVEPSASKRSPLPVWCPSSKPGWRASQLPPAGSPSTAGCARCPLQSSKPISLPTPMCCLFVIILCVSLVASSACSWRAPKSPSSACLPLAFWFRQSSKVIRISELPRPNTSSLMTPLNLWY